MIGIVARKEFRAALRDGRVRWGAVALLLLGVIALGSAAARFSTLSKERAVAQSLVEEQWTAQGEKNPHSAAHYGVYAFRPALPLSFFDPGVLAYQGVSIWLEAHKQNFATGRPADDMTALVRFGELSLAFVFQALVPLALILMGYAALSGERESGTLRQLLATGVTPGQLVLGKFAGLSLAAVVLLAPLVVLCLLALALSGGVASLGTALLLCGFYALYGAIVLGLSLVVSARADSSQSALLILLAFWALITFVVPRVAADLGRVLNPTPTAKTFLRAVEDDLASGVDGVSPAARIAQRREALLKLYKVADEKDLPINFQGVVFNVQDEISNAVYDKHFGELHAAVDAQVDLVEAAGLLSPRVALSLVSQELSGTSVHDQRSFERGAEAYRRELMTVLNRDIMMNSRSDQADYRAGPDLWRKTGGYRYVAEPLVASISRSAAPLMVLALWVGVLAAGVVTARHLRVLAQ